MAQQHDWSAIEADYRTGKYSNRELSRIHGPSEGAIRKRAKQYSWQKDLSGEVRKATRAKAITASVAKRAKDKGEEPKAQLDDREIVEAAAEYSAEIIMAHQQRIERWSRISEDLAERLEQQLEAGSMTVITKSGETASVDLQLDYISKTMMQGTSAVERLIKLERQAHGLDEDGSGDTGKTLDELLAEVAPDEDD